MKLVITDWQTLCHGEELSPACFEELAEVTVYPLTRPEEAAARIGEAQLLLCNKTPITADVIAACPNLKYIGVLATGYNNIDMQAARQAGLTVCNAGTYSTDAVAQYVFAQILYYYNSIHLYNADVRRGGWMQAPAFSYFPYPAYELRGKTLSIIGYGSIGRQVAKIADAFGMEILIATRTKPEGCPYELVSVEEAFSRADVLTIHTPLTPETKGMISRENLSRMKKSALLINTARGPIADEEALAEALKSGCIAAAALDVLESEPMRPDTPLRDIPNCIITPHIAWSPLETRQRLLGIALDNLRAFLKGTPRNVVQG
ncbi:MAG: D-2-hydroxyacid dehydrogenase [Ruminococcus sp.]|nr:D-2-hydroxyacid dehydrogenase [Ruminococcus sp.]